MKREFISIALGLLVLSTPAFAVKVEVVSLTGFSHIQAARFRQVAKNTEAVINSPGFKAMIEGWYWKKKNRFVDTTDTPKQVYAKISSKDWKLEYRLEWLWARSTIGYTYPDVPWIALNSRKWGVLDDADISANICHEAGGHKFGRYAHTFEWTPDRPYSVPYGLGYACSYFYRKMYENQN